VTSTKKELNKNELSVYKIRSYIASFAYCTLSEKTVLMYHEGFCKV